MPKQSEKREVRLCSPQWVLLLRALQTIAVELRNLTAILAETQQKEGNDDI